MAKTHFKKLQNPNYLGSWAIDEGKTLTATVKSVGKEKVIGENGQSEDCPVMHFNEESIKPLILNATNAKKMQKLTKSPYIEDWVGKKIVIGVEKVKAFGDIVDAIRIKSLASGSVKTATADTPQATNLVCESCGNPITEGFGMSADALAKYTKEKYGKQLCSTCAMSQAGK